MLKPLTAEQHHWVEQTLAGMSLEQKVGHLLCPEDRDYPVEEWLAIQREVPFGSVFFGFTPPERPLACIEAIQQASTVPVMVASDLEHGAGAMLPVCTEFPFPMALGAAGSTQLARQMGRATAREGRAYGVHWTFSPVVDLNVNFQNPVTNIRSMGDSAYRVSRLAKALIEGLQETGELAATAKHFPGDGMDDRDQHLCTSVNSCTLKRWWSSYGKVWQTAIDAGVMSVMVGHIAFPAYEGLEDEPTRALPATLNPRLQIDLLRRELGFEGVIVSDAAPMVGIASRVRAEEEAVQNILTGSDVYLFANPREDFGYLMQAVHQGRISPLRLERSVRRVLEMKARLGLHQGVKGRPLTQPEVVQFEGWAQVVAEKSIALFRANTMTPAVLHPGDRVMTVTVRHNNRRPDLVSKREVIDDELRARGLVVDHLENPPGVELLAHSAEYAAVFVNIITFPHALMGTMRLAGDLIGPFWQSFYATHANAVFTSFGSPYFLYDQPHLPNLYQAYGYDQFSQRTAVRAWLGEIEPQGGCPVRLPEKWMGLK